MRGHRDRRSGGSQAPGHGRALETGEWSEVKSPYDDTVVGRVAQGDASLVDKAVAAAHDAFEEGDFPQHDRAAVLDRAAHIVGERDGRARGGDRRRGRQAAEDRQARGAALRRHAHLLRRRGAQADRRDRPDGGRRAGAGKLGVMLRVPYGVVGAISPFNFPLNLVAHKLGPAIAAGNAVVLKPAGQTPVSALKLAGILIEAGLPEDWLSVIPGPGSEVGKVIAEHELIRAITFTGSSEVGWGIRSDSPHKKVNLELGSDAPLIIDADGDWETAAEKAKLHAFSHAGQSCISIQRILVHEDDRRRRSPSPSSSNGDAEGRRPDGRGRPTSGPLISPDDRDRVKEWIDEAVSGGAELLTGGELVDEDRCLAPTIRQPSRDAKVWCEEIFGPVATIHRFSDFDEALEMANDSKFGLQAGVFTATSGAGSRPASTLEFGGVLINEVPTFRADQQPYGGVKDSGNTREGPAYAVHELTEERFITLQG